MSTEKCACDNSEECLCPVQGIIDVVSKKWAICIVNHLGREPSLRYSEIKNTIGAISPKTLSDTLKILEREGLISRKVFPETPPRVEYSLTNKGRELKIALVPLLKWLQTQ
jgi:DNA-binding HxlR family transcriptional regulator